MSLLDRLNEGPQPKGKRCKYAVTFEQLPKDLQKRITEIVSKIVAGTGEYSASWLASELRNDGIMLNHSSILRHGRKDCCCYVNQ